MNKILGYLKSVVYYGLPRSESDSFVFLTLLDFNELNGAGLKAISPYIDLVREKVLLVSCCRGKHRVDGDGFRGIIHLNLYGSRLRFPHRMLRLFLILFTLRLKGYRNVLALTESWLDLCVLYVFKVMGFSTALWLMDNFMALYKDAYPRWKYLFLAAVFRSLRRGARFIAVVSKDFAHYLNSRWNPRKVFVIGRTSDIPPVLKGPRPPFSKARPLEIVHIGSCNHFYSEPMRVLRGLTEKIDFNLTFYGPYCPAVEILRPGRITYGGLIPSGGIDQILSKYDIGLVCYSFDDISKALLEHSFPSKIIDYLRVGIPCLAIGPSEIRSLQAIENANIGVVCNSIESSSIESALLKIWDEKDRLQWVANGPEWIRREFNFENHKDIFMEMVESF